MKLCLKRKKKYVNQFQGTVIKYVAEQNQLLVVMKNEISEKGVISDRSHYFLLGYM